MKTLTNEGRQYVEETAAKYKVSTDTVESLLKAIVSGGGTAAQFNIPELGGAGQWMRGGMVMVGDMFNSALRTHVEELCNELAAKVSTSVLFEENGEAELPQKHAGNNAGSWPAIFGTPTSTGSQNNFRYAYFAPARRLVIEEDGRRTIYDTKHHEISGVSQQQGYGQSHRFTSQDGPVDLGSLSVVSAPGEKMQPTPEIAYDVTSNADLRSSDSSDAIISTIEKINALYEKGHITEEEFRSKKQELLARL
ncbi:SHOCT domain-containing protein [Dyadobacter sandarakinus]|uniref:SHOCT domain-containing protein n=1 Tax=Dyadobacter sandarakinus TaxID=2747268 RepID=A0ABX7I8Y5_9BACT|nr:SHOCT domain-containing protein [Dyadobacter sandarakinus]QRR02173.1 SHOCT domain-containing protein [Dyadobacter sandarakinus]